MVKLYLYTRDLALTNSLNLHRFCTYDGTNSSAEVRHSEKVCRRGHIFDPVTGKRSAGVGSDRTARSCTAGAYPRSRQRVCSRDNVRRFLAARVPKADRLAMDGF